jgi:uncharacterized RDD family membrane protein YckC
VPPPPPGYAPTLPAGYQGYAPVAMGELAGFWIRFASWLLDSILYGLLMAVFIIPAAVLLGNAFDGCVSIEDSDPNSFDIVCPPGSPNGGAIAGAIVLGLIGVLVAAFLYVRALGKGQTWGMKIANVKLVRAADGLPVGFGAALGRSLFANIFSSSILYLGYLWAAWDDNKQTWHDKIISSYVVRT